MNHRQAELVVGNQRGIHGRVATRLAEIAVEYEVTFRLQHGLEIVECSSILDVLALALTHGTLISLHAEGSRAEAALIEAIAVISGQDELVAKR